MKGRLHQCGRGGSLAMFGIGLLLSLWLAGCATTPIPGASVELLNFLDGREVTRESVIFKLGQPAATFEHERILTYRVGHEPKQGYYIVTPKAMLPWQTVRYSLVLVFDEQGQLQKHRLVTVD